MKIIFEIDIRGEGGRQLREKYNGDKERWKAEYIEPRRAEARAIKAEKQRRK
jgi:hypothetical protein